MRDFKETTSQVAVIRTSKVTLSLYANLFPAEPHEFMELIQGKIKLLLNDFSNGKGDNAVFASYNLDLKDVAYLYQRAQYFSMPEEGFSGSKIIKAAEKRDGPFKGLSPVARLNIKRIAQINGEKSKSPWLISITNGYAQAANGRAKGSYYEKSGTFQKTGEATLRLTDVDFLDIFTKANRYINAYTNYVSTGLIQNGLAELDRLNQDRYQGPSSQQQTQPVQQAQPVQQTPQQSSQQLPTYAIKCMITGIVKEGNYDVGNCICNGKEFPVYFKSLPDEVADSVETGEILNLNVAMHEKKIYFMSIVQPVN